MDLQNPPTEQADRNQSNGLPKKRLKQVHGILKNTQPAQEKMKKGIVWDEDNLIYNESQKSATMKIEEPPTPYNRDYDSADDEETEEPEKKDNMQQHFDELSSKLAEAKPRRLSFSSDEDEGEEDKEESKEFKTKRSQHYNEWRILQEFRQKHKEDEDSDSDADKQNKCEQTPSIQGTRA
jgi:hypothetical protein